MEHDSWAPSFWRSLVALPLPLQSYCQGNSERAARHLVHYRTAMVSGSGEVCYLVSRNYFSFLSLWQGLFAFCSLRYANSFLLGKVDWGHFQDCLWLKVDCCSTYFWIWVQFKKKKCIKDEHISAGCSCLERYPYYFSQNKWLSHPSAIIPKTWWPSATGWWFIDLSMFDRFSLLTLLPPSDMRQLHWRLK